MKNLTSKNLGALLITSSALILAAQLVFVGVGSIFVLGSIADIGLNLLILIPFILFAMAKLTLPIIALYFGIKYFKNKPLKQNEKYGLGLIVLGIVLILYNLFFAIFVELIMFKLFTSILWGIYLSTLGYGIKNIKTISNGK